MRKSMQLMSSLGPMARLGLLVALAALSLGRSPLAEADTMLRASTSLVYGTSSDTYSFDAPGAGTVTARVSSLAWPMPLPLSALSFSATTSTDTLPGSYWSSTDPNALSTGHSETFQVGAGTYFAHIMATASGTFDLGLYSLILTFTPSAVPLPAAAGMLLIGLLVLFALRRTMRESGTRNESVMSAA
jgi:hypothetical protein